MQSRPKFMNVKKSTKIGQEEKTLISVFASSMTTANFFYLWKGESVLGSAFNHF